MTFLKKKLTSLLLTFFMISIITSCASPYIGTTVSINNNRLIKYNISVPLKPNPTFNVTDSDFDITYSIVKSDKVNEYVLDGKARFIGNGTWDTFSGAFFTLLLIKNGVVIDSVTASSGNGNLERTMDFKRKFTTEKIFDATLMTYRMSVRG